MGKQQQQIDWSSYEPQQSVAGVLRFFEQAGLRVKKSTLYDHCRDGMLKKTRAGVYTLAAVKRELAKTPGGTDGLQVILVTVDPERDTPQVLADYLSNFDPRITGLTGSPAEIKRAADEFRATFEKVPTEDDYTMDHTAGVFLFRADGRFGGIIDYHEDRRVALLKIQRLLKAAS